MRNNTDIVLLLVSLNECDLTDLEKDRMQRVITVNEKEVRAVGEGLEAAGHRHLATDVRAMVNQYLTPKA